MSQGEAAPGEAESFPEDKLTAAVDTRVPPPQAGWGWFRWGWRQLTSMRTALILLFLLAVGAIPGSLLPQRRTPPERGKAAAGLLRRSLEGAESKGTRE